MCAGRCVNSPGTGHQEGAPVTDNNPTPSRAAFGKQRIERLKAAWDKISQAGDHQMRRECSHDQGWLLYSQINTNGSIYYFNGCAVCGKQITGGQWLTHDQVNPEEATVLRDMRLANPPCAVCGAWGTEVHHWAPKELFTPCIAEHWPTSYLCQTCHAWWHDTINSLRDPGRPF